MSIRADMDAAYAARQRARNPDVCRIRTVWRMGAGARHAFAACLYAAAESGSYLNIPIVPADDIAGFELAEVAR